MAEASYLPFHYVDHLRNPGLTFSGGTVALRTYMCGNKYNGGNDNAKSLFGPLRMMRDGGSGARMNELIGGIPIDIALKGQGVPKTFVAIWDFMCRNKEQLKKLTVEVCSRREKSNGYEKNVLRKGSVHELYFEGRSDREAIQAMVDDRFFGIDCIGFAAGFLQFNEEWDKYYGGSTLQWAKWFCTVPINKAENIKPLDFLIWDGHIAVIDWVWKVLDKDTVEVDICQSSSGGPQCNERVILRETGQKFGDHRTVKFYASGTPASPVQGHPFVMRRKGFFW